MSVKFKMLLGIIRDKLIAILKKYYFPRWLVFVLDNLAVIILFFLAYLLRFNFIINDFGHRLSFEQGIITLVVYAFFAFLFRSYSGLIRHTTIIDIFYVFMCNTSALMVLLALSLVGRTFDLEHVLIIPYSILLIHYFLLTLFLFAIRIIIKILFQILTSSIVEKKKVLIFGAGSMGVIVKRVLQSDVKGNFQVVGFLDNNKNLQGRKLNGIKVYSPEVVTPKFLKKYQIESVIFAIKDISSAEKSQIIQSLLEVGAEVLDTPPAEAWLNGNLETRQIKKVELKELLGREPIVLNLKRIGLGLRGKTILVTGAAGSIGSEIVRQLTRFPIKRLVLIDQAETPFFNLENEIRGLNKPFLLNFILADVTNSEKLASIFEYFKPEIVFHAAAYKHVPIMENNPHEAVRVNIGGTQILTLLAIKHKVEKFVMISTDKAVNPTNVMGASKRICEMVVQLKAQQSANSTQFVITRFGNVLGSNGSVIPIFRKQIEEGGPITVTHPEITRYFMTIPEACQLVLEAGFMGKADEIFVFDMGKPVKIDDLARQMIRLSGLVPDQDIKIVYSGLRPGEKMYEELLADKENTLPTHHPKIMIAKVEKIEQKDLLLKIKTLINNIYSFSNEEIITWIKNIVPEYVESKVNI